MPAPVRQAAAVAGRAAGRTLPPGDSLRPCGAILRRTPEARCGPIRRRKGLCGPLFRCASVSCRRIRPLRCRVWAAAKGRYRRSSRGGCPDEETDAERFEVVHRSDGTPEVFAGGKSRRADGEQEHAGKDCGCGCHGAEQAVDAVPAGMSGRCGGRQDAVAQVVGSAGVLRGVTASRAAAAARNSAAQVGHCSRWRRSSSVKLRPSSKSMMRFWNS